MAVLISKTTILGIIILIAVVSITIASCFYISSKVDSKSDKNEEDK
ncbi:MAG: hypothetical protein K6B65_03780 [Bacilli bacterium]|nr:hypothetical protein [Bacilli bacterium]